MTVNEVGFGVEVEEGDSKRIPRGGKVDVGDEGEVGAVGDIDVEVDGPCKYLQFLFVN